MTNQCPYTIFAIYVETPRSIRLKSFEIPPDSVKRLRTYN